MQNTSQSDYQAVREWLESLGLLTAGTMTAADAKVRCAAYAGLLCDELPVTAFTKQSLVFVAAKCKFFPAFGEVSEHLAAWFRQNLPPQQRMGANPPGHAIGYVLPDLRPPSDEDVAHVEDLVAAFKTDMANKRAANKRAAEKPDQERPDPKYLQGIQLALARRDARISLNPTMIELLRQHEAP
jgi:hypothetical protein